MPRKARWANVLPPILTILRRLVATPSTTKTPKRSPTVAKEIPLVLAKGEIRTLEIGVGATVGSGVAKTIGAGAGVSFGATSATGEIDTPITVDR